MLIIDPYRFGGGTFTAPGIATTTDDRVEKATAMTGASNGKTGTASFWFRFPSNTRDGATQAIFYGYGLRIFRWWDNKWRIEGYQTGEVAPQPLTILGSSTWSSSNGSVWRHCCMSFDVANNYTHLYIDGTSDKSSGATNNYDCQYDGNYTGMFAGGDTTLEIAEFWLAYNQYVDFSVQSNREKFRSATGKPVNLGAAGATPTGTSPTVYLRGGSSNWATNLGTGGNFSVTAGTLADSATNPSD